MVGSPRLDEHSYCKENKGLELIIAIITKLVINVIKSASDGVSERDGH
jgi:hypothetical protein